MKKYYLIIAAMVLFTLTACHTKSTVADGNVSSVNNGSEEIPYKVAEGYFLRNDIKQTVIKKIDNREEFDSLFGMATVMGENGKPTPIDFSREYVIAVSMPETYHEAMLYTTGLARNDKDMIVFSYKYTIGEKRSYSITPCIIVVVSNEYSGKVIFNEE
ncbi:MAG: hypothetical protein Q4D41_06780 [Prevotellaceae bacterium]|nr:hypothetical protein [Prevotellaceae bacterium]